jgi:manganese/zinc/iron transport system substrate-binding protein
MDNFARKMYASPVCRLLAIVGSLAWLFLAGCNQVDDPRKKVVTTTGMISDLVRHVAGDTVALEQLMGPGIDPHLYRPKESAIRRLFHADLILYNGLHLEGRMVRLLDKNPKARAVSRLIPDDRLIDDEGQHDPHVWFDVSLWVYALNAVEEDLIALCPEHAELYRKNAAKYREELRALHAEVKQELATVPEKQRVLVTAHDAFRYFGRAYDIEVIGLQGVSTANQAGLRKVQEVVSLIVGRGVKALFVESSVPPDGVNAVVERCRDRGHQVTVADESLYSDAMGEPGTQGGTYPGMIRHNVRLIVDSLK